MRKVGLGLVVLIGLTACSSEYEESFTNETFQLGESLTYEMPILESEVLEPSSQDASSDNVTRLINSYWLTDQDHYINTVDVAYQLHAYDEEYMPYYIFPFDERLVGETASVTHFEKVAIDDRDWLLFEYEPYVYDEDGEEMVTVLHEYYTQSGFELYTYIFTLSATRDEFDDGAKMDASKDRMIEVIEMAEFTRNPSMAEDDLFNLLNGTWDSGETGILQFSEKDLNWYQDLSMQEGNRLEIEFDSVESLIHPTESTEYGYLNGKILVEVNGGQTTEPETPMRLLVQFVNNDTLTLVDMDYGSLYTLTRVE